MKHLYQSLISETEKFFHSNFSGVGVLFITGILSALLAFFKTVQLGVTLCLFSLLFISLLDVITGVLASRKRRERITSKTLRRGLTDKTTVGLFIVIGTLLIDVVLIHLFGLEKTYALGIFTVMTLAKEGFSIMENLNVLFPSNRMVSRILKVFNQTDKAIDKGVEDGTVLNKMVEKVTGINIQ